MPMSETDETDPTIYKALGVGCWVLGDRAGLVIRSDRLGRMISLEPIVVPAEHDVKTRLAAYPGN